MLEEAIVIVIEVLLGESEDAIFTVTGIDSTGKYVNPKYYRVVGIHDRYFIRNYYQIPYPVKLTISGTTVLMMESVRP